MNSSFKLITSGIIFLLLISLTGCSSSGSGSNNSDFSIDDLTYTGAFRMPSSTFGDSDVNYAVGVLGFNPQNKSLFIAGHSHHNAIAEFSIPEPGMQSAVADLPETGNPLQSFVTVLGVITPAEVNRITGMLYYNGSLIVNAESWYDADTNNVDTTLVINDADNIAGSMKGYFHLDGAAHSAGYMGKIPADLQDEFGGSQYFTGWSSVYSIVSRYSVGPSLWSFNPDDMINGNPSTSPEITATAYMNFGYNDGHLSDRALEWAAQGTDGPFPPSSTLWNPLSQVRYGFFIPGTRTFAVIGSTGGLTSGIGYKAVQSNGNTCGGPCPYNPDDYYNYYWLFDVDEILNAGELYEPRPYAYGIWDLPFDDDGSYPIIGATLDSESGTLYIAIAYAGQLGAYDRPPLILTYSLP